MAPQDPLTPPAEANMDMDATENVCGRIVHTGDRLEQTMTDLLAATSGRVREITGGDRISIAIRWRYLKGASGRGSDVEAQSADDIDSMVRRLSSHIADIGEKGLASVRVYREAAQATVDGFHR